MPTPDVDVFRMLDVLSSHGVVYLVIGGFAVELFEVPVPPTQDIDITPARNHQNVKRLCTALNELGARLRIEEAPDGLLIPGGVTPELVEQMKMLNLVTDAGPLDLSFEPAGTTGYEDLLARHVMFDIEGIQIAVAHLSDVARSKEAAGRAKDLLVLPAIHARLEQMNR